MTDLTESEQNHIIKLIANSSSSGFYNEIYNDHTPIINNDTCLFCGSKKYMKYDMFNRIVNFKCFCSLLCKISFESLLSNIYDFNYKYSLIPHSLYHVEDYEEIKDYVENNAINNTKFDLFTEFKENYMELTVFFINNFKLKHSKHFKIKLNTNKKTCFYCGLKNKNIHSIQCKHIDIKGCCSIMCKYIFETFIINTLKPLEINIIYKMVPYELISSTLSVVNLLNEYKNATNVIMFSNLQNNNLYLIVRELTYLNE